MGFKLLSVFRRMVTRAEVYAGVTGRGAGNGLDVHMVQRLCELRQVSLWTFSRFGNGQYLEGHTGHRLVGIDFLHTLRHVASL